MSTQYLVFQLYGAMASWGEVSVGEVRESADHPTKSAITGMIAAALGLRRNEEDRQVALANSLRFAVLLESPGILMQDFHSAQVAGGKQGRDLPTRADELAHSKQLTMLSTRQYRCDARYRIALWLKDKSAPFSLEKLALALQEPKFTLYLGRKACPPALPLAPQIIESSALLNALSEYNVQDYFQTENPPSLGGFSTQRKMRLYWEPDSEIDIGIESHQVNSRWDDVRSRSRWQFSRRREAMAMVDADLFAPKD